MVERLLAKEKVAGSSPVSRSLYINLRDNLRFFIYTEEKFMLPINIDFLFIHLHNYEGIFFFIAILSAIIYLAILCKDNNIDVEVMFEAIFISLLVALASGRLFSFLFWNPKYFFSNPLVFFKPWEGGITVTGGVLGGLITGFIYAKVKKLDFFYHIRFFVPAILVGQIIGRFGCFLNGDAAGKPTSLPWGVVFHPESVAYSNAATNFSKAYPAVGTPLHPTQLYEIFGNLILLTLILATGKNEWITRRRIVWYALGYSLIRFIVEFFRSDSVKWFSVFTTGHQITIIGFSIGILLLIWTIIFDKKLEPNEARIARPKKK